MQSTHAKSGSGTTLDKYLPASARNTPKLTPKVAPLALPGPDEDFALGAPAEKSPPRRKDTVLADSYTIGGGNGPATHAAAQTSVLASPPGK